MANISYLNMIQVLVKLKDLSGAETCYKEWESNCSTHDIRVVNSLLSAYTKEDRLKKVEILKKRAKQIGARLNAKTWEIFMEYYLRKGDMKSVLRCVDRGIKKSISHSRIWVPPNEAILAVMPYFEEEDSEGAESCDVVL
ncbi:pentatricopeptide repeat-containing protein [Iris pallida]|uniref:Pentatricopeptide repeat-containing protein n=1 Tax=Iris pallida TaxID=29817 RepID=A0AAX6IAX0_IRIPA|nr:pentatricopeptide repeat-containing protein [Iris pallida]KAJ6850063.1 pentatricopeptide repeat-containing protein [Iris pallida]